MAETPNPAAALDAKTSLRRFVLEIGPLGAFFVGYVGWNLMVATAVLMAAVVAALAISYRTERKVPLMPIVTAVMVLIFGGLTLILQDETFIKMKPTIVNGLFATALFAGLAFGKPLLQPLLGSVLQLDLAGWKKLSLRWACFFVFMACLNEFVWRSFSTDFWVNFKVWGNFPLTLIFAAAQYPLILRHMPKPEPAPAE
jgi:intracellular septation protein